jgi:hypothetical protein
MRKDSRATGQAGEYFVAAEICRRGATATTFTANMPGYDIVAGDATGNRQVQISVKAKNTPSFWTTNGVRDAEARPDGEVPRFLEAHAKPGFSHASSQVSDLREGSFA